MKLTVGEFAKSLSCPSVQTSNLWFVRIEQCVPSTSGLLHVLCLSAMLFDAKYRANLHGIKGDTECPAVHYMSIVCIRSIVDFAELKQRC